ncbi:uncharacterized protein LOC131860206 [Cryptomeria japonica]|uniref:uncharacterized protein LOC131860206 n=1 Tax=Cryptomeria japonica TaxID=3369 RepID=UPI0027DAAD9D|nr:uncharacterized protein LOC131860206 [Cryptomeria japonica]
MRSRPTPKEECAAERKDQSDETLGSVPLDPELKSTTETKDLRTFRMLPNYAFSEKGLSPAMRCMECEDEGFNTFKYFWLKAYIWPCQNGDCFLYWCLILPSFSCSHIIPEYSFLDARGLGKYEGRSLDDINEIYAADLISPNARPPPFTDGTPNESVADVYVRVTQLMSILETQYSSQNVIIISPDSDNLTILQADASVYLFSSFSNCRHSELFFNPGEVRFVDIRTIPAPKKPPSGLFKCLKPPNCN